MYSTGIKPKKSLGQNFLIDKNVTQKIVASLSLSQHDVALEIGPGFGALTESVQSQVKMLFAVEIDQKLTDHLLANFRQHHNVKILNDDFLKLDLSTLHVSQKLRVFGNIPYNISSPVIFKSFECAGYISDLTLLVQKEVALRIIARPSTKDYGILSVMSQLFAETAILMHVPSTVFAPKPKVDSALVRWTFTNKRLNQVKDPEFFRKVVRQAFGQRRKMMRNSLKGLHLEKLENSRFLTMRPEEIAIPDWIELANNLS